MLASRARWRPGRWNGPGCRTDWRRSTSGAPGSRTRSSAGRPGSTGPSMACSDWRVMLSLVRRTASMPCIIDSSSWLRLLAERVGERLARGLHGVGQRARLLADGAVDGDGRAHACQSSNSVRRSAKAASSARVRSTQLDVEGLGAAGQRGVEGDRIVVEHRLQLLRCGWRARSPGCRWRWTAGSPARSGSGRRPR